MNTNLRILILTYSYPPLLDAASIFITKLIRNLNRLGVELWVICSQPPKSSLFLKLLGIQLDHYLFQLLPDNINTLRISDTATRFFMKSLGKWFPFFELSPDENWIFALKSINAAVKIIRNGKIDLLFTRGMPMSCHVAGHIIKRRTGIPWISYWSDPWVTNPYHVGLVGPLGKRINVFLEKRVLQNSDRVVFVTDTTRETVLGNYTVDWREKCHLVPHCFDRELSFLSANKHVKMTSNLTITHVGKLYHKRRPDWLFVALKEILDENPTLSQDLTLLFIGRVEERMKKLIKELSIDDFVHWLPPVSYLESLQYIHSSDILLLIDAPSDDPSPFLPSKLADYLGSGRPIFALTPKRGETASLVKQINGWIVEPDNVQEIKTALLEILKKWEKGTLMEHRYSPDALKQYSAGEATSKLIGVFEELCGGGNRK